MSSKLGQNRPNTDLCGAHKQAQGSKRAFDPISQPRVELITKMIIAQIQFNKNIQDGINCLQDLILRKQNPPINSFYLEDESDEDEPLEEENIKEISDVLTMGDKEVKVNPLEEINDLVPIPKVSEKPCDSTSVETASVETRGEKNMTESLADKQEGEDET